MNQSIGEPGANEHSGSLRWESFETGELSFDNLLVDFNDIQAELHYHQAQETLRDLVEKLNLTPREQAGLESELGNLKSLLHKLENQVVQIAVFGMVGRGKSSLLNALLGRSLFETGPTHGVTQSIQAADWNLQRESVQGSRHDLLRVSLRGVGSSKVELLDTPGIDEVNGEDRERLARQVARQADLILFVVAGDITKVEFDALSELRQASKPMLLVFNKVDQYPEADRRKIYAKICDERLKELLSPEEIVMAAASPLLVTAVRQADGRVVMQRTVGKPQVDALKLKILEVLNREGKALVALNTMLYADEVNEQVIQQKLAIRDRNANDLIWSGVMTKAMAIALNPLTVLDLLGGAAIDITLILALSKLYGLPMTQQAALGLLKTIAVSLGGITATELLVTFGLGSLKSLLGAATPLTGGISLAPYVSVALAQGAVAGGSSYAIAQITKTYLANGASWGPDGPKAVITRILESLDEDSILNRIKDELRAKLGQKTVYKAEE